MVQVHFVCVHFLSFFLEESGGYSEKISLQRSTMDPVRKREWYVWLLSQIWPPNPFDTEFAQIGSKGLSWLQMQSDASDAYWS